MLNADVYAEVIDRHVELASGIGWLISLLDNTDPPQDRRRQRRARNSPAVQIEGQIAGEELGKRIVVITQLAEELDRTTLELALRIVPLEWWEDRLRCRRRSRQVSVRMRPSRPDDLMVTGRAKLRA
jgi:hypothetical protein